MINLDQMNSWELGRFHQAARMSTTAVARKHFPTTDRELAAQAVSVLAMYANNRIRLLACSDPAMRSRFASIGDSIYQQIPEFARWEVTV